MARHLVPRLGCIILVAIVTSSNASGALVTYSGSVHDVGSAAATLFGTDGYDLYATSLPGEPTSSGSDPFGPTRLLDMPGYLISILSAGANAHYRSNSYQLITNPQTGTQVHAGLAYNFSPSNQEKGLLSIRFGLNPPPVLYVGNVTDTGDGAWDYPNTLRFKQTTGIGAGNCGLITLDEDSDMGVDLFFFRISGAQPNDVITISGSETTCGVNWCNLTTAGLLFTQVPEPGSLSLFVIACATVLFRRR